MFKQTTATVFVLIFCSGLMAQDLPVVNTGGYTKVFRGKEEAFEKAVSSHIAKWHGVGQWNQYGARVLTGPKAGQYMIGTTGHYWKDFDERKATEAHNNDWGRILNNYVEGGTGVEYLVKEPDASYNDRRSAMAVITYYYCKPGRRSDMIDIMKKAVVADKAADHEDSYGVYRLVASGRNDVFAIVGRMDGMADLGPDNTTIRERWVAKYGEEESNKAGEVWRDSHWSSESAIIQLVESMTTPPSN
jgi:hypothetical protein|tara:strand:+ start:2538 stop:3275 length:738 start_codon:yes stop_codon:yes gene_type:complete